MARISSSNTNGSDSLPTTFTVNLKNSKNGLPVDSPFRTDLSSEASKNGIPHYEIITDDGADEDIEEGEEATVSVALLVQGPPVNRNWNEDSTQNECSSSNCEFKEFLEKAREDFKHKWENPAS
ncbi:hypothetical protein L596_003120 [Steinernema carpocapsae]|uniref:Uncharacterized protein n=1 Tax=Steinernema carpocapsae TaxID=34508 RepID=A0A4U8URG9_STECR|nr:hypothetical protein L596_003120 [Steinernema carpocapsae]